MRKRTTSCAVQNTGLSEPTWIWTWEIQGKRVLRETCTDRTKEIGPERTPPYGIRCWQNSSLGSLIQDRENWSTTACMHVFSCYAGLRFHVLVAFPTEKLLKHWRASPCMKRKESKPLEAASPSSGHTDSSRLLQQRPVSQASQASQYFIIWAIRKYLEYAETRAESKKEKN